MVVCDDFVVVCDDFGVVCGISMDLCKVTIVVFVSIKTLTKNLI